MLWILRPGAGLRPATGTAFADLLVDGHRESWPIRSKRFRGWLRRRYYEATGGAHAGHAISSALDLLEARAQFNAPERSVHVRIAEHGGHIYLDLADERWRAVEISPDGWQVNRCPPVRFRRPGGMLPLPVPEPGGSIEALLPSTSPVATISCGWSRGYWRRCDPAALRVHMMQTARPQSKRSSRRTGGGLRAGTDSRTRQLGGNCLRPSATCRWRFLETKRGLAKKSRRPRWPAASFADVPSRAEG